jgi:hypothetical protein
VSEVKLEKPNMLKVKYLKEGIPGHNVTVEFVVFSARYVNAF